MAMVPSPLPEVASDVGSDVDIDLDFELQDISDTGEEVGHFDIVIPMMTSERQANQTLVEVKKWFADEKTVKTVGVKKIAWVPNLNGG